MASGYGVERLGGRVSEAGHGARDGPGGPPALQGPGQLRPVHGHPRGGIRLLPGSCRIVPAARTGNAAVPFGPRPGPHRLASFAEHDDIKSLRDEIALTRMMIEGLWNSAQSDVERLAIYGRVNSHILTLEKLVKTCNQIEERLGNLLAKSTLLRVGTQICQLLVNALEGLPNYEQLVDALIHDIIAVIEQARNDAVPALPAPTQSES